MSVRQKLGVTLKSKVVQKFCLEKKVFTKKWSPRLIFLDKIKKKIDSSQKLTLKVRFWHF